ncbi:MAG: NUDIX hydrolase [Syntrophobacteraceae bacterium]|nr:NUDIX hydrolase [Syntrophobacteraceae bacterium]
MNRRYPEKPLVGVGAIIFRNDSVLLIQRGREPSRGKWSIPGGLVEVGESLHNAVAREVFEESGMDVTVRDLVVALDRVIHDADGKIEYHYVLLDFLCEAGPGEPAPASDALNCAFVPIEDLPRFILTAGTEQAILRAYSLNRGARHPVYDPTY